jgi:RimJ/RimL family protein N-acetyltransferase
MTSSIRLRPIVEDDLLWLRRFRTEPDALGQHEWMGYLDPGWLDKRLRDDGFLSDDGGWLVATTQDDEPAGIVTWSRARYSKNPASWCWEVGVALLPEHRGSGIGTAAQRLLVSYLFETTPVVRLQAGTDIDNRAEQRALEKVGFRREGVLRSAVFQRGRWRDVALYSLLRTDPA